MEITEGRRQLLLTGETEDYFFIDPIHGTCSLEDALFHYAVQMGYDVVVSFDTRLELRFAKSEMETLYQQTVSRKSVDPRNTSDPGASRNRKRPHAPDDKIKTDEAVTQATQDAVTKEQSQLDLMTRLIKSSQKSFIVFKHPEYWNYNLAEDQEKLKTMLKWRTVFPGHDETCSLLVINKALYESFIQTMDVFSNDRHIKTKEIELGPPDVKEIEFFLQRIQCRYALQGNPVRYAREFQAKKIRLYNIVSTLSKRMKNRLKNNGCSFDELFENEEASERRRIFETAKAELDSLIGLKPVKTKVEELISQAKRLKADYAAGKEASMESTHTLFLGEPGTGKTIVARILGKIYYGLGIRSSDKIIEISASDITSSYNPGETVNNMKQKIDEAMGGVLFVDEVYLFAEDNWLKQALQELMKQMEDKRHHFTVIMAGYRDKLPKLWAVNKGFKSRIGNNVIDFDDYSEEELLMIFQMQIQMKGRTLSPAAVEKAKAYINSRERLGGIGNGRGVRDLVKDICKRADLQGLNDHIEEDMIPDSVSMQTDKAKLILNDIEQKFLGLNNLKKHLKSLLATQDFNKKTGKINFGSQHLIFLGNPGTGKTTIVEYLARYFFYLGITSRTGLKICDAAHDFSDPRTVREKFDEALGGVLFIDEAYRMAESPEGREALSQITQIITERKYKDLVIILTGYHDRMQEVFNANSGLARRFQKINFDDLTVEELQLIFQQCLEEDNSQIPPEESEEFVHVLKQELSSRRKKIHFGNAGDIKNYFQEVCQRRAMRCYENSYIDPKFICVSDLKPQIGGQESLDDILAELERDFIGLQSVKNRIKTLAKLIKKSKAHGLPGPPKSDIALLGPPGTGKSTIARYMARIFNALEMIDGRSVIERTAVSLKGTHIGDAQKNVRQLYENARSSGSVIFLDEAYALYREGMSYRDSYSDEVIAQLIAELTLPANERIITIIAGYEKEMIYFLEDGNPGLNHRFRTRITFPNYTLEECLQILLLKFEKSGHSFDSTQQDEIHQFLLDVIVKKMNQKTFANARSMENLCDDIINQHVDNSSLTVTLEDLQKMSL